MANSKLQGTLHGIPEEVMEHLKATLQRVQDGHWASASGIKRLNGLIERGYCSYEQLKRIKNFFDHHPMKTKKDQLEFDLNGGEPMKEWVNWKLQKIREAIYGKAKTAADTAQVTADDLTAPEAHTPEAINRAVVDTADTFLSTSDLNRDLSEQVAKMKQLIKTI